MAILMLESRRLMMLATMEAALAVRMRAHTHPQADHHKGPLHHHL